MAQGPGQSALVAAAEKIGVYTKRVQIGDRMVTRWACKCAACGTERVWGWENNTSTRFMLQNMNGAGWTQDKRGLICDSCTEAEKKDRKMSKIDSINPKLQRKVFNLLDDHFDEDRRLYRSGWSDKKIAEAAETSEQFVITLRRGAYGELAEDPAVTALRAEITALSEEMRLLADTTMEQMGKIEEKITQLHVRLNTYEQKRVA